MLPRRSIACVALVLLVQLSASAALAVSLWPGPSRSAAQACRCPHGESVFVCPMHKAPSQQARCTIRSTHDEDAALLGGTFALIGVLPVAGALSSPAPHSTPVQSRAPVASSRFQPPDFPPPRS